MRWLLVEIRKEGVTDEDIRWWWNRHDLERGMTRHMDYWIAFSQFKSRIIEGFDEEAAADYARKYYPFYGDHRDTSRFTGDDRPLPHELGNRINNYLEKRAGEKQILEVELKASSSFNALVRKEIREGRL